MKKVTKLRQLAELSKDLGIDLPTIKGKLDSKALRSQSAKLVQYAQEHRVVITPVGYGYFVESYNQFGECPCDETRTSCPCPEADEEIKLKGRCLCHLFWRDYQTFFDFRKEN